MDLPSVPTEILVLVYKALIHPGGKYATSVVLLAATCRRFLAVLHGTKSIWIDMFAACFDIMDHHNHPCFDIEHEYKGRMLALASPMLLFHDNQLCKLIFENEKKNLETLVTARCYPEVLQILGGELAMHCRAFREVLEPIPSELLTAAEALMSLDTSTAKTVFSNFSCTRFLNDVRENFVDHRLDALGYVGAQLRHLSMLELLVKYPVVDISPPCIYTTRQLLGAVDGLRRMYHPNELALLAGQWAGHYGFNQINRMDGPMRLTLSISEATDHHAPDASESETAIRRLQGQGADMTGSFIVHGWVWATGEVRFSKQYIGAHAWRYRGRLLPWGIAGCWEGGPFWIWRLPE